MIQFTDVYKRYTNRHEALSGLSFELQQGEMAFLTGHSGAGKSTFLKNMIEKNGIKGTINEIYYFMPQIETLNIKTKPNQMNFICK